MDTLYRAHRVTVTLTEDEVKQWVDEQRRLGIRDTTLVRSNQLFDQITWAWLNGTKAETGTGEVI